MAARVRQSPLGGQRERGDKPLQRGNACLLRLHDVGRRERETVIVIVVGFERTRGRDGEFELIGDVVVDPPLGEGDVEHRVHAELVALLRIGA